MDKDVFEVIKWYNIYIKARGELQQGGENIDKETLGRIVVELMCHATVPRPPDKFLSIKKKELPELPTVEETAKTTVKPSNNAFPGIGG